MSRIYGGIHWAFDNTAGLESGRKIGGEAAMPVHQRGVLQAAHRAAHPRAVFALVVQG